MAKKERKYFTMLCFKCVKDIPDAPLVEGTKVKCPHCGHEFVFTEEGLKDVMRDIATRIKNRLVK